jgi:hypothetical protein
MLNFCKDSFGHPFFVRFYVFVFLIAAAGTISSVYAAPAEYFQITVLDDQSGRGVPLVELRTVNDVRYYTDSNGIVAINDPELMGQSVYFHVSSPGYEYPVDSYGNSGTAETVTAGGKAVIKIKRDNIAERLYRLTGAGIYRDSVLTGKSVPIKQPLLNGLVVGQDTVEVTPYQGKLYWFFGDTMRPSYPLGQYSTSGAASLLPSDGGLDPSIGVDLTYWVDKSGFSRGMIPLPESPGPVWVGGLFTMLDSGKEHLFTHFSEIKKGMEVVKAGLAEFDDQSAVFKPVCTYDFKNSLQPDGHPFRVSEGGTKYLYFEDGQTAGFPLIRCRPDLKTVTDLAEYEGFTCLSKGAHFDGANTQLDRAAGDGHLIWGWKKGTPPLNYAQMNDLESSGRIKAGENVYLLRDIDTDKAIHSTGGSVYWNAYCMRWIMITTEEGGSPSHLGEVWFAAADSPAGPWVYARKIATHDHYTFYNPTQHPFFDQDGGRVIYFEGTYTDAFSDVKDITPRYNYNQLMYRVALDDNRLSLPEPVYLVHSANGALYYAMREQVAAAGVWKSIVSIPFYAVPGSRSGAGLIPIYAVDNAARLSAQKASAIDVPLFYALPAVKSASENDLPNVTALAVQKNAAGTTAYTNDQSAAPGAPALCRVWRNPSASVMLDYDATPLP